MTMGDRIKPGSKWTPDNANAAETKRDSKDGTGSQSADRANDTPLPNRSPSHDTHRQA